MQERNQSIQKKLARLQSAMLHLRDAKQALENDLFDSIPSGRLDAHYKSIAESIDMAMQNLKEV